VLSKFPVVLALIHVLYQVEYLGWLRWKILSRCGVVICRFLDLVVLVGFEGAEIGLT
jgi:hypothetical protein